jgi:hypothetical protein
MAELFGEDLADTSYAIGYLKACVEEGYPGVVFKGLEHVLAKNADCAPIVLPAFAPYLTHQEIEQLHVSFPFLSAYIEQNREALLALAS